LTTFIYGLCDPRNGELRYVGKTRNPRRRLSRHTTELKNDYRSNWIRSLLSDGFKPEMFIIEDVSDDKWDEAERFWISYFKYIGANLTNLSGGGRGVYGLSPSTETKLKLHEANKGRKPSQQAIDGAVKRTKGRTLEEMYGNWKASEIKSVMGRPGIPRRPHSQAHKDSISKSKKKRWNEDSEFRAERMQMYQSKEHREKLSRGRLDTSAYVLSYKMPAMLLAPDGLTVVEVQEPYEFCQKNALRLRSFWRMLRGERYSYKGWMLYQSGS
jgi:hypothetical protein